MRLQKYLKTITIHLIMTTDLINEESIKLIKEELTHDLISDWNYNITIHLADYDKIKNPTQADRLKFSEKIFKAEKVLDSGLEEITNTLSVLNNHIGEELLPCYRCPKAKENWHCDSYKNNKFCSPGAVVSIDDFDEIGMFEWSSARQKHYL
jgi:hypothetical protein